MGNWVRHERWPVNWGSYSGERLEKLMAVFVAQDYPDATRRTPSSGDGGVDILIPDDDSWHVRQVNTFTKRLTQEMLDGVFERVQMVLAEGE